MYTIFIPERKSKMEDVKTIKLNDFEYNLIQMVRELLDAVYPGTTTMGMSAAFGAIFALNELTEFRAKLCSTPKGQLYMALVKIMKDNPGISRNH